jgi:hypothetical protein
MAGPQLQVEGIANLKAIRILNAPGAIDVNSLEGIDTLSIPNRSLCYVVENESLYRFFEESAVPPAPPAIVQPNFGGQLQPGRWILVSSGGGGAGGCMVSSKLLLDVAQTIASGAGPLLVDFNDVEINTLGGADLPNDQIIIPTPGVYILNATALFDDEGLTDENFQSQILVNGTPVAGFGNTDPSLEVTEVVELVAGDLVTMTVSQTNTGGDPTDLTRATLSATSTDCGAGDLAGLDLVGDFGFFGVSVIALTGGSFEDATVPWVPGPANAGFTHLGAGVVRYDGPFAAKFKVEATIAGNQDTGDAQTFIIAVSKTPGLADQRPIGQVFDDLAIEHVETHLVQTISPGDELVVRLQATSLTFDFNCNQASLTITPAGGVATPTQTLPAGLFGAKIFGTTSVPNTGVPTDLTLDTVEFDGDNMADVANDQLTVNTSGRFIVTLGVEFTVLPDTGAAGFLVLLDGVPVPQDASVIESASQGTITAHLDLTAGQVLTAQAFQSDSGGAQDVTARLAAQRVS